jgi:hypothetical protein
VDASPLTAWDELELEVQGAPEEDHLSLRFRFDPKGPPPHAPCRALALQRDEELETQVVRHLEQQRASPGIWELRLCVNNKFRLQRLVRVAFPPPEVPADAASQPLGAAPSPGTLTGPLTGELLKHVRQHIEDAEQLKMALGLVPEEEDEESAPPPEPLWLQAAKSEKAELLFAKLGTFLDGWLDAKLEEQRAKTSVARARAEQMGVTPAPQHGDGPPTVRLHSVNGAAPNKVEDPM